MERESLVLEYDGGSAADGEMDAYRAAAAVIAFSSFLSRTAKHVIDPNADVRTTVRAFSAGSFDVNIALEVTGISVNLFAAGVLGPEVVVNHLKEIFSIYRHLRGAPPQRTVRSPDGVSIENNNGIVANFSHASVQVAMDPSAGRDLYKVVGGPLSGGATSLSISHSGGDRIDHIEQDEAVYFRAPGVVQVLVDREFRMTLRIDTVNFREGNKWRFVDIAASKPSDIVRFWADIRDDEFVSQINSGAVRFGKGDTIVAQVRIVEEADAAGSTTVRRSLTKIVSHTPPTTQQALEGLEPTD